MALKSALGSPTMPVVTADVDPTCPITHLLIDAGALVSPPATPRAVVGHFAQAAEGDVCAVCHAAGHAAADHHHYDHAQHDDVMEAKKSALVKSRGIEVGHAFYLGTKYSSVVRWRAWEFG